jgi:hypothetical protein
VKKFIGSGRDLIVNDGSKGRCVKFMGNIGGQYPTPQVWYRVSASVPCDALLISI